MGSMDNITTQVHKELYSKDIQCEGLSMNSQFQAPKLTSDGLCMTARWVMRRKGGLPLPKTSFGASCSQNDHGVASEVYDNGDNHCAEHKGD